MKVKVPRYQIKQALMTARPVLWLDAKRVYSRKDGKFVPIGWTGTYVFDWNGKRHSYILLDEDLD